MKKLFVAVVVVSAVMAGNQGYAINEAANSQEAVFGQAKWIGAPADRIHFMPERLTVFSLGFDLLMDSKSSASFIYGADDPRLQHLQPGEQEGRIVCQDRFPARRHHRPVSLRLLAERQPI